MPIELDCPRCKHRLSVPSKKAGGYATCPRCKGRFWVPETTAQEPQRTGPAGGAVGAASVATPATSVPIRATPPVAASPPGPSLAAPVPGFPAGQRPGVPSATPQVPAVQPAPAAPPVGSPRKVARLIAAEAAESTLKPAEDGKLPELRLREPGQTAEKEAGSGGMSPLVLFGLLSLSVVVSLVLVFAPTDSQTPTKRSARKQARETIQDKFFTDQGSPGPERQYQVYLREAQQEYARGDFKREREFYRRVLGLLRAERGSKFDEGLTGSQDRDRELEEQIMILLSE